MKLIIYTLLLCLPIITLGQTTSLNGTIQKQFTIRQGETDTLLTTPHETKLRLYNYSSKKWSDYAYTDKQGAFTFENIEPGSYKIQIDDPVVKVKNQIYVQIENPGNNTLSPFIVDRLAKTVKVDRKR
jgi:hypothetical protein